MNTKETMNALRETKSALREIKLLLDCFKVGYAVVVKKHIGELEKLSPEDSDVIQVILSKAKKEILAGMGSLNDVWICRDNGHEVDDEESANKELEHLRIKLRRVLEDY